MACMYTHTYIYYTCIHTYIHTPQLCYMYSEVKGRLLKNAKEVSESCRQSSSAAVKGGGGSSSAASSPGNIVRANWSFSAAVVMVLAAVTRLRV